MNWPKCLGVGLGLEGLLLFASRQFLPSASAEIDRAPANVAFDHPLLEEEMKEKLFGNIVYRNLGFLHGKSRGMRTVLLTAE
jgi:hypothetical protein